MVVGPGQGTGPAVRLAVAVGDNGVVGRVDVSLTNMQSRSVRPRYRFSSARGEVRVDLTVTPPSQPQSRLYPSIRFLAVDTVPIRFHTVDESLELMGDRPGTGAARGRPASDCHSRLEERNGLGP